MIGQAKAGRKGLVRGGRRTLTRVALAFIFAAVVALTGSAAHACPKAERGIHHTVGERTFGHVAPKITAVLTAAAADQNFAKKKLPCSGPCCGLGCHAHGMSCASGCGSASHAAIDVADSTFDFPASSQSIAMVDLSDATSIKPPPNFRPPRFL